MNPVRAALKQQLLDHVAKGENPVSFLLGLVNDKGADPELRAYASALLLPYCLGRPVAARDGCPSQPAQEPPT